MDDVAARTRDWVEGWTRMRGLSHTEVLGGALVRVGSASRETELVCVEPDPETWALALAAIARDPRAMLSVVSPVAGTYVATLPPGVRVDRDDETLMTCALRAPTTSTGPGVVAAAPVSFEMQVDDEVVRRTVRLVRERSVAAEGAVGVRGPVATYDAVETGRAHRRQGLGRWVMRELDRYAVAAGAERGILVATPRGAQLYGSLGWRAVAPMRSLMGVGPG